MLEPEVFTLTKRYLDFIESCRAKSYPVGTVTQDHHINPRHNGGTDEASNLIPLSHSDHLEAHKILWQDWGNCANLKTLVLMEGDMGISSSLTEEMRLLHRKKMSEASKTRYENPEARLKMSEAVRKAKGTPEARLKMSEAQKKRFENPEARLKMSEAQKKYFQDPEARLKNSEAQKKRFESPEARLKNSEAIKNGWAIRKANKSNS